MTTKEKRLVDEYLDYHRELVKKYGNQSVVLLQNGSFFEIYNYRQSDGPDIYALADLLNIQVSRRDKKELEINNVNYEMAGFPTWAKQKFVQLLLNANYTIAVYIQIENNKKITRILDEVISPSTNIDYINQVDNNYLMSILIDTYQTQQTTSYICGYSLIDLSVGRNYLYESGNQPNDFDYGLDKLYETIKIFNPKEIVIYLNDQQQVITKDKIMSHLELDIDNRTIHLYHNQLNETYYKPSFQNHFLGTIFPNHGMLSPIEFLDLEKYPNAIVSYLLLLEFAKSHRTNIIEKITRPELMEATDQLLLTLNSIYQLSLVPDKNQESKRTNSLLGILNNCSTSIGKRLFRHRLLHPITNVNHLEQQYNQIELLYQNKNYQEIEPILGQILDLERIFRRLSLGILSLGEFYNLHKSNQSIIECQNKLGKLNCNSLQMPDQLSDRLNQFINEYSQLLNLDIIYKFSNNQIERNIFIVGNFPEIDQLDQQINQLDDRQQQFAKQLSRLIDGKENMINLENNDKEGFYLTLTNNRSAILKERLKNWTFVHNDNQFNYQLKHFNFKTGASTCKIFHDDLKNWGNNITILKQTIHKHSTIIYNQLLKQLETNYFSMFQQIVTFVGHLDLIKTHAKNIGLYQLTRPIIDSTEGSSYLEIDGTRHLLVEQLQRQVAFVTNDVYLGNGHPHNILCYGYNAVGKTTLQKSICLAVIMAQSGGFVPAERMKFRPFNRLFTRISNVDNLLKGQSSYMVEMLELKYILKHANANSLVCIDELVASTESYSGISSVVATLKILHDRNTCLFMATHLHQLATMDRINQLKGLVIKHLEVYYDANRQLLVYDRKLKDGSGSGLYGLEVARYLDLPSEFLDLAFKVRNELLDLKIVDKRTSHFNHNIVVDKCQICQQTNRETQLDVHHINFQCHSDDNGNFKNFHKNIDHNLIVLCKKCHNDVHNYQIILDGYQFTSNGIQLNYHQQSSQSEIKLTQNKPTQTRKTKYTEEQSKEIREFLSTFDKNVNKKYLLDQISKKYGYRISYTKLNKLLTITV